MGFPQDPPLTREQMIDTYVYTAAQVLGSVEEAKKKIYACSTTTYTGFHVDIDEDTSRKFEGLPGVIWVIADSYVDPVNKEYGGDKYINGEIIPRSPPHSHGKRRQCEPSTPQRRGTNNMLPQHDGSNESQTTEVSPTTS